jgi:N-acetylglucosaminyldiphosphoundecaprenol N-acetyl-beta-D-mannosaminyltransferase
MIESLEERLSIGNLGQRRRRRWTSSLRWVFWVGLLTGLKRILDLTIALSCIVLLSPVIIFLFAAAKLSGGGVDRLPRLGRWAASFDLYSFRFGGVLDRSPLRKIPALFNVVRGELSFIGPRPMRPEEVSAAERLAWRRFELRPGLICLWWIRRRANIAYSAETAIDAEYIDSQGLWGDLGIAARAIPAVLYGSSMTEVPERITLLGVPIRNLSMDEALNEIVARARAATASQLCFVNADCVNIAFRDARYRTLLNGNDFTLADGIGVKLAGRILNQSIRQNVNGTDLFPRLCQSVAEHKLRLFLLGGRPGVPETVLEWIGKNYPQAEVRGVRNGYFEEGEEAETIQRIAASGADLLLVAFGAPKQDLWIQENLPKLGVKLAMGVGGLFDFYSGRIPRAPLWVREIGMEWFFRFYCEPRRMFRRYFAGNVVFLVRAIRERIGGDR